MSHPYPDAHKLFTLMQRMSPDDITVSLAYTTMLRLPATHPYRLANQAAMSNAVSFLALRLGQDPEWVQTAFEQRVEELGLTHEAA